MLFLPKKLALGLLFLLLTIQTLAQDSCYSCNKDSLYTQLYLTQKGAEKIKLLQLVIDFDPTVDSANFFIEQLIGLNKEHKVVEVAPYYKIKVGNDYRKANYIDSALSFYQQAISLFDRQQKKMPNLLLSVRNLFNLLNAQEERYHFYKTKLNYYLINGPYENTAACYHGIAGYFTYTADYNQAISYYLKGAEVFKKFYPYWYYNATGIIGLYYAEWGNLEKAMAYLDFALPKIKSSSRVPETANGYYEYELAKIKLRQKNYSEVLKHAHTLLNTFQNDTTNRFYAIGLLYKALALVSSGSLPLAYPLLLQAKRLNDHFHKGRMTTFNSTVEIDYGLFYYYRSLKKYAIAEKHLLEAYRKAIEEKSSNLQLKYLKDLSDVAAHRRQFARSRMYTENLFDLENTLEEAQNKFKIAQYENEQKYVAQLQNIALLKQEQAAQKAIINKRNIVIAISLIALALIATSMVFLYRQLKINKRTLNKLKTTQVQLVQKEKMASLGELTAGIAHEIQNPLNFVNNFSEVTSEMVDEVKEDVLLGRSNEALLSLEEIKANLQKVTYHGKRADAIVKNMMQHSRTASGEKKTTDINAIVEEYLRLAYHGFRVKDSTFSVILETHYEPSVGKADVLPQEIGRVLLNLFNNALYSVQQKKKLQNGSYEPQLQVSTCKTNGRIVIAVKDNGTGMSDKIAEKVFQPFFTTKPTGEGTGLGLSLSYDIITKGHGGELLVHSTEGEGSEFVISLPHK